MATLRPPPTSRSPSPSRDGGRNPNARASMGPSQRIASGVSQAGGGGLAPSSPRPMGMSGGARPTSELLGTGPKFQTPEAEAIDQWFENLQNYEVTLEEMAAASMDANFKEELGAIEQWFRVLSEAERTAALYSLLQSATQVQIRFFITVLQQMARSDPMTALLSPSQSGTMQQQMEAKLSSMGLKSPGVNAPAGRNFSTGAGNRQSLAVDSPSNSFLSPDAALISPGGPSNGSEAAVTLAQQRAKLKANAAHRISAPGTLAADGSRSVWGQGAPSLGQVVEGATTPSNEDGRVSPAPGAGASINSVRPKSTDFSGVLRNNLRGVAGNTAAASENNPEDQLSPMVGGNWASMVNTPLMPMFPNASPDRAEAPGQGQTLDAVTSRLANWSMSNSNGGKVQLEDAKKYRRASRSNPGNEGNGVYDENGNLVNTNGSQPGATSGNRLRGVSSNSNIGSGGNFLSPPSAQPGSGTNWGGPRSPTIGSAFSSRFGGSDDTASQLANLNMGSPSAANNFNGLGSGLTSPNLNMGLGMSGFGGMGMGGLNMNMPMLNAMNGMNGMNMGLHPNMDMQTQLLAAQLAAGGMMNPAMFAGMQANNRRGGGGGRSPGGNKSHSGRSDNGAKDKNGEEEVDPKLLDDIPGWLRSLRLHKYTPNFQGKHWKEMVIMDEAALEAQGVAALGARRKMLKTFELVRAKMGIEMPNPPDIPA